MNNGETLRELAKLLWSIGDTLDEMDHTGKKLWDRIEAIGAKITELALTLPDSGSEGRIKRKILGTSHLYLGWSQCVDQIERVIGPARARFSQLTDPAGSPDD